MKTITTYLFLLIFSVAFLSCAEEKEMELEIEIEPDSVEFDNLKIGDIMLYSYQTGQASLENIDDNNVSYTGDTLELKVIDKIDGKFLIQEQITPGSAIFNSEEKYIWGNLEEPYQLLWDIREDSIIVTNVGFENLWQSQLIFGGYYFSLNEITEIEIEFDGWRTTLPDWYSGVEFLNELPRCKHTRYHYVHFIMTFYC